MAADICRPPLVDLAFGLGDLLRGERLAKF
jgi:hypothetical protein